MFKDVFKTIQVGYLIAHDVYADFFLIWQKDKKEEKESPINVYTDIFKTGHIYADSFLIRAAPCFLYKGRTLHLVALYILSHLRKYAL